MRKQFNKVFPTHWSFMLGEVALYSFIVLLLSGTYLGLFFDPSMTEVVYNGPFENLRGVAHEPGLRAARCTSRSRSAAACSSGRCTTGPRCCSSPRCSRTCSATFFTGAFRKPREANWVIGLLLIFVGTFEGFTGYSLPGRPAVGHRPADRLGHHAVASR